MTILAVLPFQSNRQPVTSYNDPCFLKTYVVLRKEEKDLTAFAGHLISVTLASHRGRSSSPRKISFVFLDASVLFATYGSKASVIMRIKSIRLQFECCCAET